jgi:glycosyltransferase involved in cell wall biosynthesis
LFSPKISIIIPVYNVEAYLEECLDSILSQDLHEIEIICVNDGSTDSSLSILERYAAKNKRIIIIDQLNSGPGKARNIGLKKAQGEYIFFPDSDDYLLTPNALSLLYTTASENNLDILSSNFATVGEEKKESHAKRKAGIISSGKQFLLSGETNASAWAKLYKRSYLDSTHFLFDETILYEDSEAFPRFYYNASRVSHIDAVLYAYRKRANSIMTQNVNLKHFTGLKAIIAIYIALLKNEPDRNFQKYLKKQIYNNVLYFNELILRSNLPSSSVDELYLEIKSSLPFSKLELFLVHNDEKFIQSRQKDTNNIFSYPTLYLLRKLRKILI